MFGEWISVKDRMPEVSGTYLVYFECGAISIERYHNSPYIFQDEFEDDYEGPGFYEFQDYYDYGELVGYGLCKIDTITHWALLPEPPKSDI